MVIFNNNIKRKNIGYSFVLLKFQGKREFH